MTRRECGSCRFFERSGIGESGYCRNQRCVDIVGMALVRRHELACRIGWDEDFYEPIPDPNDVIPGQDRPTIDPARQRSGYQGIRPDDIIVAIEQPRPITKEAAMPSGGRSRASNVGEAHRRALERRQQAQQAGDPVVPRRIEGALSAPPDERVYRPTAAPPTEDARPQREPGTAEGVSLPRIVPSGTSSRPYIPSPSTLGRQEREWDPLSAAGPGEPSADLTTTTPLDRVEAPPPSAPLPSREAPQWPPSSASQPQYPPGAADYSPPRAAPYGNPTPQYNGEPAPYSPTDTANGRPLDPLVAEWQNAERQRHRGKRCGNCRDFQAAESGDRGWCKNRFAFPTPQLVFPNDLACLSCLGTWWAASDQWWLAKAASGQNHGPTPNADRLLEEMQNEERQRATHRRGGTA